MVSEDAGDGLIPDSGCNRWKGNSNLLLLFAARVAGVVAPAPASLPNCRQFEFAGLVCARLPPPGMLAAHLHLLSFYAALPSQC